jgi:hypothetical protein
MTIFLDRCVPRSIARGLQVVRSDVVWFEDVTHFTPTTQDSEWLRFVGQQGWLAITRDKRIASRPAERTAVVTYGVGLFVLAYRQNLNIWGMFRLIVGSLDEMLQKFGQTPRPFLFAVYRDRPMRQLPL